MLLLIQITRGDSWYLVKVLHERNNKLWYYPETGLMCNKDCVLVNTEEWMSKKLTWKNVYHAPRLVLKVLKVL